MPAVKLLAPPEYWLLKPEERDLYVNGCGPEGWLGNIVPDHPLWFDFKPACWIHDYEYAEGVTEYDWRLANRHLYANMVRIIRATTQSRIQRSLGYGIARLYLDAVEGAIGHSVFFRGKDKFLGVLMVEGEVELT